MYASFLEKGHTYLYIPFNIFNILLSQTTRPLFNINPQHEILIYLLAKCKHR